MAALHWRCLKYRFHMRKRFTLARKHDDTRAEIQATARASPALPFSSRCLNPSPQTLALVAIIYNYLSMSAFARASSRTKSVIAPHYATRHAKHAHGEYRTQRKYAARNTSQLLQVGPDARLFNSRSKPTSRPHAEESYTYPHNAQLTQPTPPCTSK